MGPDGMILVFWMLSLKPAFSLSLSPSSTGSLVPLHILSLKWYHYALNKTGPWQIIDVKHISFSKFTWKFQKWISLLKTVTLKILMVISWQWAVLCPNDHKCWTAEPHPWELAWKRLSLVWQHSLCSGRLRSCRHVTVVDYVGVQGTGSLLWRSPQLVATALDLQTWGLCFPPASPVSQKTVSVPISRAPCCPNTTSLWCSVFLQWPLGQVTGLTWITPSGKQRETTSRLLADVNLRGMCGGL